jgi:ABC-2 type transport system permease protein
MRASSAGPGQSFPTAVVKHSSAGPVARAAALWRKRGVLGLLVRRDLKVRYSESVLGYLWSILDPLLMGLIYWFVFTTVFKRTVGQEPYILFLLSGMLPFMWFQNAVNGSPSAIKGERLVRSTALPREIWILRLVLSKGCEYLFSLPVLALFAIGYQHGVTWWIVMMIPAMVVQVVLLTGLSLLISPLGALVRDVDRVVRILMRFMFYATPIIYGLSDITENKKIPAFLHYLYDLNPMTGIIAMYRAGFFPSELHWNPIFASMIGSVVIFVVGWWVFTRFEPAVLKEI